MRFRLTLLLVILGTAIAVSIGSRPALAVVDRAYFTNFQVVSKTATTATISWNTPTGSACQRVNYGWVVNQLNTGPANEVGPCGQTTHTATLSGLDSGPSGTPTPGPNGPRFLFEVVNIGKESGQRAFIFGDVTFSNIRVINITKTSATIEFSTNIDVCAILKYGLNAGSMNTEIHECPNPEVSYTPTSTHSIPLTGLLPGTAYYFSMSVFGDATATTAAQSFTTLSDSVGAASLPTTSDEVTITSINVTQISSNSATVTFSYSGKPAVSPLQYQVVYGQNVSYSSPLVPPKTLPGAFGTEIFTLAGLSNNTTYNFSIQLCTVPSPAGNCRDILVVSADRAFTTAATGGGGPGILIDQIRSDCINTSCVIYFATNQLARVEICWATSALGSFPSGTCTSEAADGNGFRSLRIPAAVQPAFTNSTKYHYRMQAVGAFGATFTTGGLTLTTSANSFDHTFATGSCTSGGVTVDIGSCLGTKLCMAGGALVEDCTKCGYVCPVKQTCRSGALAGSCDPDPELNGSPSQCNNSSCYTSSRTFINPAAAQCYSSWSSCNANTILKVRNDRGCNLWLSCETSLKKIASASGPAENLCLALGACNSLNSKGQCNNYLPAGQCNNDPLRFCSRDTDCQGSGTCNYSDSNEPTKALKTMTYAMPKDQSRIADLSGNVVAGIDWGLQGGANVIQGQLPWQLMREIGGISQIINGDFERRAPEYTPWLVAPIGTKSLTKIKVDFEEKNVGPNHILLVEPDVATPLSGTVSSIFTTLSSEYYFAEARIKAANGSPRVKLQFGYDNYQSFEVTSRYCSNDNTKACVTDSECGAGNTCLTGPTINTSVTITATSAWQRVTLGPIKGMRGPTRVGVVCADSPTCTAFEVDDVQVKPILQIDTNPNYMTPSCRLYPKNDSPACDYIDANDIQYRGWHGYCLERDSQTGTCLSWWPVDIIKGDASIFGAEKTAGYSDRQPLYLCAESAGNAAIWYCDGSPSKRCISDSDCGGPACRKFAGPGRGPYFTASDYVNYRVGPSSFKATIMTNGNSSNTGAITATQDDAGLRESDIQSVYWIPASEIYAYQNVPFYFENNQAFQDTTRDGTSLGPFPYSFGDNGNKYSIGRTTSTAYTTETATGKFTNTNGDTIWYVSSGCNPGQGNGGSSANCTAHALLVFDRVTGLLKSYVLDAWDTTGTQEPIPYHVRFYLREPCNKIVQVVTPDGQNQAFAQRASSGVYQVPTLNYGRAVDFPPFGGVVIPENLDSNDPSQWPILAAETRILGSLPGQARSGTPFACEGNCNGARCYSKVFITEATTTDCGTASGAVKCSQIDSDLDGEADGFCMGVNPPKYSIETTRGAQIIDPLHNPTQADPGKPADNPYFAQERIRRLFAKSYGVWETTNDNGGARYNKYTVVDTELKGTALVPYWMAKVSCSTDQTFQKYTAGSCAAEACGTTTTKDVGTTVFSFPRYSTEQAAITAAYNKCRGQLACGNDSQCVAPGGGYTFKPELEWTGPTELCHTDGTSGKYERRGFADDFCAIPPTIFNVGFVDRNEKEITLLGGNGEVSLRFNTSADPEQVPLQSIAIDWGEPNVAPKVIDFRFAPHNDPRNPHVFTKAYKCETPTPCEFDIKIQVIDNWGWGNDAVKNGSLTDPDNVPDTLYQPDKSTWSDPKLKVIVQR